MGKRKLNKPIYMGAGWTPVSLVLCLNEKAYMKATRHWKDIRGEYPANLHASVTQFHGRSPYMARAVVTIAKEWQDKKASMLMPLIAHEAVHYAQFVEDRQGSKLDEETQAYIVQRVTWEIYEAIRAVVKKR